MAHVYGGGFNSQGQGHAAVLTLGGRASLWGINLDGQLGLGAAGEAQHQPATNLWLATHNLTSLATGAAFECVVIGLFLLWVNAGGHDWSFYLPKQDFSQFCWLENGRVRVRQWEGGGVSLLVMFDIE